MNNSFKNEIKNIAKSILIDLSEEEATYIATEYSIWEKDIHAMQKLDNHSTSIKTYPIDIENVFLREDDDVHHLDQKDILNNAPTKEKDYITIEKVKL